MNLFASAFTVVVVATLVASIKRPVVGVIALIGLVPLYYVIRGLAGQSPFAFLWPYLYVLAYAHILCVRGMREQFGAPVRSQPWRLPWGLLWLAYAAVAVAAVVWASWIRMIVSTPIMDALRNFNDSRVVVFGGLGILLTAGPSVAILWHSKGWRQLTWLDWSIAALLAYGLLHVALGFARTGHAFYVLESFRYYFAMLAVYFVARFGLQSMQDVRWVVTAIVSTSLVASVEFIAEHYLFNSGVSSLSLPWLRAFDGVFTGYGRPIPMDGWWVMTPNTDSLWVPYGGVRGIGLFLHPHTLALFAVIGTAFLVPGVFDARRRALSVGLIVLPLYAVILSLARFPFLLALGALLTLPAAAAYLLREHFARRRLWVYAVVACSTLYFGSIVSPGGRIPYFMWGFYARPFAMSVRAALGDLGIRATSGNAGEAAPLAGDAPSALTVASGSDETPSFDRAIRGSIAVAGGTAQLLWSTPTLPLLFGQGFSPLTRYVVDFFPEAAQYRYIQSTADLVYLEYFQQFGIIGLGLLLAHFAVFAVAAARIAKRGAGNETQTIALASGFVVVLVAFALVHLYPIFRIGVNTTYFVVLGIIGFMHARDHLTETSLC